VDGSVWISWIGRPRKDHPHGSQNQLTEVYEPPYLNPARPSDESVGAHALTSIARTGVIWTGLNSGHYAEFDAASARAR